MERDDEIPTAKELPELESGPIDSQGLWPAPRPTPWKRLVQRIQNLGGQRETIGRFEVIRVIGKGGFGIVMLAHDPKLGRDVALKLSLKMRANETLHEARLLAKLAHPNIVKVHEAGAYDDNPFFVMEYVAGIDGGQFIGESEDWQSVVRVYIAAGRGLAAAHRQGVVHVDFKPANVLIGDDGQVKVSDFGMGQLIMGEARYGIGTRAYMAPEIILGHTATPHSDQWSFCVALWETLETVRPFQHVEANLKVKQSLSTWLEAVCERRLLTGKQPYALMTEELRGILEVGLSFSAIDRFPSMDALVSELDKLLQGDVPYPADAGGVVLPEPPQRRRLAPKFVVAALCAACTLGGVEVGERTGFSLSRVVLAPDDPLARAQSAAADGDGETTLAELNRVFSRTRQMSATDIDRLTLAVDQIARTLEITCPEDANEAWVFAERFRRIHR